jgi:hypothetical protein
MLNLTRFLLTFFLLISSVKAMACERCGVLALKHYEDSSQFISFGKTNFNFGFNSGQHPNFIDVSGRMNFFVGYQGDVELFGTSFTVNSRISSEKFRSGRPSFFQIAYNPYALKRRIQRDYQLELDSLNLIQKKNQDSLYQLEGSYSYLQMQKHEAMVILKEQLKNSLSKYIVKKLKPLSIDTTSIQIPDTSGVPTFSSQKELDLYIDKILNNKVPIDSSILNAYDLQNLTELNQINGKIETINSTISSQKELITSCALQIASTQGKIDDLKSWNSKSFIEGIKKVDLGMGVLSQGGMSNNSIPIQGIHVAGEYRNYFYDFAAGLTIPNQLFSTSVFDQVNQNTNTLFNITSFNQINTTRFVSSAVIGKGDKEKTFISLDSYYSGRSLEAIRMKKDESRSQTENISFGFGSISKLRFTGSFGSSFIYGDSLKPGKDNLAASGKISYRLSRTNSDFVFQSKYVGLRYDGFSQGIYTVGFIHNDVAWSQKIGKLFFIKTTVFNDQFLPRSITAKKFEIKGISNDINLRISSSLSFNFGGSWVYSSGNDSLRSGWNPLLKGGYNYNQKGHRYNFVSSGSYSQMHVLTLDSNLNIINSSIKVGLQSKRLYIGVKGTYQNFKGIERMYGEHWFIQPEITLSFKGRKTEFEAKCQGTYSISKQFGEQYGGKLNFIASPSEYFTWVFSMQKWLKNDAVYFLASNPDNLRGYFLEFKMILHLNVNK